MALIFNSPKRLLSARMFQIASRLINIEIRNSIIVSFLSYRSYVNCHIFVCRKRALLDTHVLIDVYRVLTVCYIIYDIHYAVYSVYP